MAIDSKYKVVRTTSKIDLENEINDLIRKGYEPVGSVSYDWIGGVYCQSVFKKNKKRKKKNGEE